MSTTIGWLFLVGVAALFAAATVFRRRSIAGGQELEHAPEALSSLGLTPVRPRPQSETSGSPKELADQTSIPAHAPLPPKPVTRGPFASDSTPLWAAGQHTAAAMLVGSLAAYLKGTVAVLRASDGQYHVDALSVAKSLAPRPIPRDGSPIDKIVADGGLTELNAAARSALSYHLDPAETVGQAVAIGLAAPPARRVLLIADTPPGAEPITEQSARLILQYAGILAGLSDLEEPPAADEPADTDQTDGTVLDTAEPPPADEFDESEAFDEPSAVDDEGVSASDVPVPPETAETTVEPSVEPSVEEDPFAPPPVPRLSILDEEVLSAERTSRTLSFGIVTLDNAEEVLQGDATLIAAESAALQERLESCPLVRRVETFGDLIVGIFLNGALSAHMHDELGFVLKEEPMLRAGLAQATGIGGHVRSEAVRGAATAALERAFDEQLLIVFAPSADEQND